MEPDDGNRMSPLWMQTAMVHEYPHLDRDAETMVCVVGAGIAGLTTAYLLAREGKGVVVLDDGPIAHGESGRTTAHLATALDDRYHRLERLHGHDGARLAAESHGAAIDLIERLVADERIDCGFERVDGYLFAAPGGMHEELDLELAAAHRAGLAGVELVERAPLGGFDSGPCLRFPRQAQFHPLRYLDALAKAIVRMGGRIHAHTHVDRIDSGPRPGVRTADGHTVSASTVVVATNVPVNTLVAMHTKQAPYRSYVIAIAVPAGSVRRALYWDTGEPYHYLRVEDARVGDHQILIVGGEDHKTGHVPDGDPFARLEAWTRERFPGAGEVVARWSGQIIEPVDGLAFIGPNPHDRTQLPVLDSGPVPSPAIHDPQRPLGVPHHTDSLGRMPGDDASARDGQELATPQQADQDLVLAVAGANAESDGEAAWVHPVYIATGDSGNGMTHGTIAGMILDDLICGRTNAWSRLYDPRRRTLRALPRFAQENLDVARQYATWVTPGDVPGAERIAPGSGAVIRRGLSKLAVYRAPDGAVHACSAVCPHLRCVVAWNGIEGTWDCPCHGSRFTAHGVVLNGPAITDLEPARPPEAPAHVPPAPHVAGSRRTRCVLGIAASAKHAESMVAALRDTGFAAEAIDVLALVPGDDAGRPSADPAPLLTSFALAAGAGGEPAMAPAPMGAGIGTGLLGDGDEPVSLLALGLGRRAARRWQRELHAGDLLLAVRVGDRAAAASARHVLEALAARAVTATSLRRARHRPPPTHAPS